MAGFSRTKANPNMAQSFLGLASASVTHSAHARRSNRNPALQTGAPNLQCHTNPATRLEEYSPHGAGLSELNTHLKRSFFLMGYRESQAAIQFRPGGKLRSVPRTIAPNGVAAGARVQAGATGLQISRTPDIGHASTYQRTGFVSSK
jgi:hypothetical protein